jgi:hypothetical protein
MYADHVHRRARMHRQSWINGDVCISVLFCDAQFNRSACANHNSSQFIQGNNVHAQVWTIPCSNDQYIELRIQLILM